MFEDPIVLTMFIASLVLLVFLILIAVLYASQKKNNRIKMEEKEAKLNFLRKEHKDEKK